MLKALHEYKESIKAKDIVIPDSKQIVRMWSDLGMVLDLQMGSLADESEFFKRLEVLLDRNNREHFINTIDDRTIDPNMNNLLNREAERFGIERFLIKEVGGKMEEKLGEEFAKNIHHGLQHSIDLLEKAKKLVVKLNKEDAVDWKVLIVAIYLHDIFAGESEFHGYKAAEFIDKKVKKEDSFTQEQIEKIKQAVAFHDKKLSLGVSDVLQNLNIETKILYDVDNLDAFGIKGIYRYFAAHISRGLEKQKSEQQILAHIKQRVADNVEQRRNNLYFKQSRQMADMEFSLTKMFFDKLIEEDYPVQAKKGATGVFTFIWNHFQDMPWTISEKAQAYFKDQDNVQDEDEMFASLFFNRLEQQYSIAKQIINDKEYLNSKSPQFTLKHKIDSMLDLIDQAI